MSLEKNYLEYPKRKYGMDHDFYEWSMINDRKPVLWPNKKTLALWVNVNLQFFPLNQRKTPVAVPGGMKMPYPDLRHFSLRDYGNRIGIFRILKALDKYNVKPTFAINGALIQRVPYLIDVVKDRGDEVIAHGWQMDMLHTGDLDKQEESEWIDRTASALAKTFGSISGWLSPGRLQTPNTAELLVEHGFSYMCDWVNDDLPYTFNTSSGGITAMPLSNELDDYFILNSNLHSEDSYAIQIQDAANYLASESKTEGGRILAMNIHPWLLGQPHRIAHLEKTLEHITSIKEVYTASASEIVTHWNGQQK